MNFSFQTFQNEATKFSLQWALALYEKFFASFIRIWLRKEFVWISWSKDALYLEIAVENNSIEIF